MQWKCILWTSQYCFSNTIGKNVPCIVVCKHLDVMLQMCALWSSKYWQVDDAESYEDTMRTSGINIEIEACPSYILVYPLFI